MLLITAALGEELKTGTELCRRQKTLPHRSISLRQAVRRDRTIFFLKTGVGPRRSAASLEEALKIVEVSQILVIGYAGALDPGLKLGDMVAVQSALALSLEESNPTWENARLDGTYELTQSDSLARFASSLALTAETGNVLTSSHVLGNPAHKKMLFEKFRASIVDMETAALARVAASGNVPISCIRVISDEACDTFLDPFSHDPAQNIAERASKLLSNGMLQTYRKWKNHTLVASRSLTEFLTHYL